MATICASLLMLSIVVLGSMWSPGRQGAIRHDGVCTDRFMGTRHWCQEVSRPTPHNAAAVPHPGNRNLVSARLAQLSPDAYVRGLGLSRTSRECPSSFCRADRI